MDEYHLINKQIADRAAINWIEDIEVLDEDYGKYIEDSGDIDEMCYEANENGGAIINNEGRILWGLFDSGEWDYMPYQLEDNSLLHGDSVEGIKNYIACFL